MATGSYSDTFGGGGWKGYGSYLNTKNKRITDQLKERYRDDDDNSEAVQVFQDCIFWLDGRTRVPEYRLKMLMIRHGGEYESYNLSRVTHVVADNLAVGNKRWREIRDKGRASFFVVTSEWIMACVEKGSRIRESYFTPDCLQARSEGFGSIFRFVNSGERPAVGSVDALASPVGPRGISAVDGTVTRASDLTEERPPTLAPHSTEPASQNDKSVRAPVTHGSPVLCTDAEPNFVENFFKASRLHFIGRWRERILSRHVLSVFIPPVSPESPTAGTGPNVLMSSNNRRANKGIPTLTKFLKGASASALDTPPAPSSSFDTQILHVDFDAFFVSVALTKHPELKSKPVAVCHGNTHSSGSEIASCNYIARTYGITKGMWMRHATQLCPDLHTLPYDFEAIEKASLAMFDILTDVTSRVLPMSCDEAYVQLVGPVETRFVEDIAAWIRDQVIQLTGCRVSIGIGPNLLLAKLAGQRAKPSNNDQYGRAGIYRIHPPYDAFMSSITLNELPGIGQRALEKLNSLGLRTCSDIVNLSSLAELQNLLGNKNGAVCYSFAKGCDIRPIPSIQGIGAAGTDSDRSLTVSVNWGIRLTAEAGVRNLLQQMARECEKRLNMSNLITHDITLKILRRAQHAPVEPAKYGGCGECDEFAKRVPIPVGVVDADALTEHFYRLWKRLVSTDGCPITDLRGVSIVMSKLKKKLPARSIHLSRQISVQSLQTNATTKTTPSYTDATRHSATASGGIANTDHQDDDVALLTELEVLDDLLPSRSLLSSSETKTVENLTSPFQDQYGTDSVALLSSSEPSYATAVTTDVPGASSPRFPCPAAAVSPSSDDGEADDDDNDTGKEARTALDHNAALTFQKSKLLAVILPVDLPSSSAPFSGKEDRAENLTPTVSMCENDGSCKEPREVLQPTPFSSKSFQPQPKPDTAPFSHRPLKRANLANDEHNTQARKRSRPTAVMPKGRGTGAKAKTLSSAQTKDSTQLTLFQLVQKASHTSHRNVPASASSRRPLTTARASEKQPQRIPPELGEPEIVDLDDDDDASNDGFLDGPCSGLDSNASDCKPRPTADSHRLPDNSPPTQPSALFNPTLPAKEEAVVSNILPNASTSVSSSSDDHSWSDSFLKELMMSKDTSFQTERTYVEIRQELLASKANTEETQSICTLSSSASSDESSYSEVELTYCPNVVRVSLPHNSAMSPASGNEASLVDTVDRSSNSRDPLTHDAVDAPGARSSNDDDREPSPAPGSRTSSASPIPPVDLSSDSHICDGSPIEWHIVAPVQNVPGDSFSLDLLALKEDVETRARMFRNTDLLSLAVSTSPTRHGRSRYSHDVCGGSLPDFVQFRHLAPYATSPFSSYVSWIANACWMCVAKHITEDILRTSPLSRSLLFTRFSFTLLVLCWTVGTFPGSHNGEPLALCPFSFTDSLDPAASLRSCRLPVARILEEVWGICACFELHRDLDIRSAFLSHFLLLLEQPRTIMECSSSMMLSSRPEQSTPVPPALSPLLQQLHILRRAMCPRSDHVQSRLFMITLKDLHASIQRLARDQAD